VLDPISRLSEIIFGLIMVLTFTGSISAASSGRSEIGVILWAALGCNVAWGIVDAFMYIMSLMMERGDAAHALRTAQQSGSEEAVEQIKEYLPPAIATVMTKEQLESICLGLRNLPQPPSRIPLFWRDIRAAILIFFLVALSTLPCSIPFLLIKDPGTAMRVSNLVAIILLFIAGFRLATYTGYNKLLFGIIVAVLGFVLVGMTIALGG
jgi:VIT1/CCC1 family predicted Fe2+/Mn2+ transporter